MIISMVMIMKVMMSNFTSESFSWMLKGVIMLMMITMIAMILNLMPERFMLIPQDLIMLMIMMKNPVVFPS